MPATRCPVARPQTDAHRRSAPQLVLGLSDGPLRDEVTSHFRSLGWVVTAADSTVEAGWVAHRARPAAMVLSADQPGESGFLTCAKVRLATPACRVVLIGPENDSAARRARYAGAVNYLAEPAEATTIAQAVLGN